MILKPGTGTNPYYARKHGHEIPNTLDKVLAGLCSDYQPTGATNSVDAAEMLWKGERIEFAHGSSETPAVTSPKLSYVPSAETFGRRPSLSTPASTPVSTPAPQPEIGLADLPQLLAPGQGWSAQDSQRQLQALQNCPADSARGVISSAFDQSVRLGDKAFAKSGWGAALMTGTLVTGVAAVVTAFTNPGLALGLASGAMAGACGSVLLVADARKDSNNSAILSDMGRRLDARTWGQEYDRHGSHGNYLADFKPGR
ncbi:hypothetical protein ABS71_22950 [bacterium SCN 62-11]|nr:hypothetical protein [Candidatus Eremiobacteraeota bacterium]ODT55423.1 MAG: hypothetical protein ABS71_22950 [bacterium SCN 62-11]